MGRITHIRVYPPPGRVTRRYRVLMDDRAELTSSHRLVITTLDDEAAAERMARSLVEARLAACAQLVGPVRSVFRWAGEVTAETEWQLHVKTTAEAVGAVTEHILAHHTYDEPEVIAVPITGGSPGYLAWVTAETG